MLISQPTLAMGLGGICIIGKILRKRPNMVSLDVYATIHNYLNDIERRGQYLL